MSDSIHFAALHAEAEEAKIRLYGVLWLLYEAGLITAARAKELGRMPLRDLIAACQRYAENSMD